MKRCLAPILMIVVVAFAASGCYSTARINSDPPGARVTLDGNKDLGTTPIHLRDMVWIWTNHQLLFEKEGYYSQTAVLRSKFAWEYLIACLCTGGILMPTVVAAKYPGVVSVSLQPKAEGDDEEVSENHAIDFHESSVAHR